MEFSDSTDALVRLLKPYPAVFVITDRKVCRFVTEPVVEACAEAGVAIRGVLQMRISERRKTFRTVCRMLRWLVDAGADRDALVLAVGGGVTTDLAGFAACIYKRGVKYANVPTTLLSQVDASTGGKTGFNIGGYKNMAGVIAQPEFTFINPDFIRTLPWNEYTAGYAELLKTFIIGDAEAYRKAVGLDNPSDLAPLIRRAVEIKSSIVERDEFDNGERKMLNLGHTFAHAMEYRSAHCLVRRAIPGERSFLGLTSHRLSHGHAVAMGVIMAARLSEEKGIAAHGLADTLASDFDKVGLPTECPWTMEQLRGIMKKDKKAEDGSVRFILIHETGHCEAMNIDL